MAAHPDLIRVVKMSKKMEAVFWSRYFGNTCYCPVALDEWHLCHV
jgi:hypothetical protein